MAKCRIGAPRGASGSGTSGSASAATSPRGSPGRTTWRSSARRSDSAWRRRCWRTPVGGCRADIVCRDAATLSPVVIEAQLERSDHSHLGQVVAYAAGHRGLRRDLAGGRVPRPPPGRARPAEPPGRPPLFRGGAGDVEAGRHGRADIHRRLAALRPAPGDEGGARPPGSPPAAPSACPASRRARSASSDEESPFPARAKALDRRGATAEESGGTGREFRGRLAGVRGVPESTAIHRRIRFAARRARR